MTLNAVIALILRFIAEFDRFLGRLYHSGWRPPITPIMSTIAIFSSSSSLLLLAKTITHPAARSLCDSWASCLLCCNASAFVICAVKNYLLTYVYCLQSCIQQWGFGRTVCAADDFEIVIVFWGILESPSSDVRKHPSVAKVLDLPLTILQSIIEYFDNSISYVFTFTNVTLTKGC